ncbi:P-loop containing nucleoside triphosphate hydrolase protein [Colletotrichum cereale]|nr:P-loop containing nucleoside triphosphate hydrolase protein [Colletotrichum cereale]
MPILVTTCCQSSHFIHLLLSALGWSTVLLSRNLVQRLLWVTYIPLLVLGALERPGTTSPIILIACQLLRIMVILLLPLGTARQRPSTQINGDSEERQPFVSGPSQDEARQTNYGTEQFHDESSTELASEGSEYNDDDSDSDDDASMKRRRAKKLQEKGGWWGYLKDFTTFIPFLVPRNDRKIQFSIFLCLVSLTGRRAINILIPRQLGIVTDLILEKQAPYGALPIWLLFSLINNESGLGLAEQLAKIPIRQFSYRQITNAAFNHVMSFPMEFHAERDSAEIMKAVEQGESLINAYVSLTMLVASVAFATLEVFTSNFNIANRRASSNAEREEARIMHQATVSYLNMFGFENRRFGQAVNTHLSASRNLVLYEISHGRASTGDFVLLLSYWDFLIYPLKFLSHHYRYLMKDLVYAERLVNLLQTKSTIVEKENVTVLRDAKGHVAFEDVQFSLAQSSIMKLLLRFYDVTSGRMTVDGHDLRDITLSSLRDVLGVVPQDPLLFNASVMENLRYARPSATDEEVFEACRAAAIHERILTFADGYESKVGEQGVKLSGGEVQRLAIARVFLKNPPILILDEATSAVDTKTEASIQHALDALKSGRTTFIIALRLPTVVNADKIIVIHKGRVAESGTHSELLAKGGIYEDLWRRQIGGAS